MIEEIKKIFCILLCIAVIIGIFSGCAKINYVIKEGIIKSINEIKSGEWQNNYEPGEADNDPITIEQFKAGTYGGVKMETMEDAVSYYVEAYNYTKSLTAEYIDVDGNTVTWYKLLGDESMSASNILINGTKNLMINSIVPEIVSSLFTPGLRGLCPCENRDPNLDVDENGETLQESRLTEDDVLAANVVDNDDGTITITIQPKATEMSHSGLDSQGNFFVVLGAVDDTVNQISVLSWSEGSTADNLKVTYKGGYGKVKIDTTTKEIIEADYHETVYISAVHANISVIKNKSGSLIITDDFHYPASDEYPMETKGCKRSAV